MGAEGAELPVGDGGGLASLLDSPPEPLPAGEELDGAGVSLGTMALLDPAAELTTMEEGAGVNGPPGITETEPTEIGGKEKTGPESIVAQ